MIHNCLSKGDVNSLNEFCSQWHSKLGCANDKPAVLHLANKKNCVRNKMGFEDLI